MYNYNQWNEKDNKHIYPYGDLYESLEMCGFLYADTLSQAKKLLLKHNEAWDSDCILLDYTEQQCRDELERRKMEALCKTQKQEM